MAPAGEVVSGIRRRRGRRWVFAIVAAVLLLVAGAVAAVAVSLHYLHAPTLQGPGSFVWGPPDNLSTKFVDHGDHQSLVVPVRRGHKQSFYVSFSNTSSVTQTILGPANTDHAHEEPDSVAVSTRDNVDTNLLDYQLPYRSGPVAVPPGAERYLRYTVRVEDCWSRGRSAVVSGLDLRVRVGWFVRTEHIDFDGQRFVLVARQLTC